MLDDRLSLGRFTDFVEFEAHKSGSPAGDGDVGSGRSVLADGRQGDGRDGARAEIERFVQTDETHVVLESGRIEIGMPDGSVHAAPLLVTDLVAEAVLTSDHSGVIDIVDPVISWKKKVVICKEPVRGSSSSRKEEPLCFRWKSSC